MKYFTKEKLFFLLMMMIIISCEGEQGDVGISSLVNVTNENPGSNCENGGLKIDTGLDNNSNGILESNEILNTNFICNGIDGNNSLNTIISEPAGQNCQNGGVKINSGLDINGNGILEDNEVTTIAYVCNGSDGNSSLTTITNENSGANCENGGIKIDSGVDFNDNGILENSEITVTSFVCNGINGMLSLINITDIPASAECENGGVKIDSGIDINNDGSLDDIEIQSSQNICNGIDGKFSEEIRLILSNQGRSSTSISSNTNFKFGEIVKFDKRNWSNVTSIIYITDINTSDVNNECFVELYNETDNLPINNSLISTTSNDFINLESLNIYNDLPDKEIVLSLVIRSENNGIDVGFTGKSELIIYREN